MADRRVGLLDSVDAERRESHDEESTDELAQLLDSVFLDSVFLDSVPIAAGSWTLSRHADGGWTKLDRIRTTQT